MTEKSKKYDRQIRLWGDHGQHALETSSVCLLNVTATGTETLKNLVLPGIGGFFIADANVVTSNDLGNNFFFEPSDLGASKAKAATRLLTELNPDVKGEYIELDPKYLIERDINFFLRFSAVIVSTLDENILSKLAPFLWENNIHLVICVSYGLVGYLRLAVKELCITESHPDDTIEDLRLLDPFEEIINHVDSINLENMDKKDHSHTPSLVLLFKYLDDWKKTHEGLAPSNYKQKKEFKQLILTSRRKTDDGVYEDEENFEEAAKQANTALLPNQLPSNVVNVFENCKCTNLTSESSKFWIMAHAVKQFSEKYGCLPLRGSLPDMISDSKSYIDLQNIYNDKAKADANIVMENVAQLSATLGQGNGKVSETDVRHFCRNSHFLQVLQTRPVQDEFHSPASSVVEALQSNENSDVLWYVMLKALGHFQTCHGRYPGSDFDEGVQVDINRLKSSLADVLKRWNVPNAVEAIPEDYIHEVCRSGGVELHAVASVMGGIAAHEVIKLITRQYVPVDNAFIYNGYKSTTTSIKV